MKRKVLTVALLAPALIAGSAAAQNFDRATDPDQQTALGVTVAQIDDADLVDQDGREIGEVEAVLLGDSGEPSSVLVELEDDVFDRERLVEIELDGLTTKEDNDFVDFWDDEIDLVTTEPISAFEALPDWRDNQSPRQN